MKIPITIIISLGFLAPAIWADQASDASRWWDLVPSAKSHFAGGHASEKVSEEEREVLKRTEFEAWIDYEDEFICFSYPKHPLIKLNVKKPEQRITVEGGVCSTVDNSFQQAYVLTVGDATYAVFLLSPSKWFDDGICMCGPMVYDAYKLNDGSATRFSMLPGGAVKKAQVVGGGLRFMAFEWTHLACPRSSYERMVASMEIKTKDPGGNEALRKKLIDEYGAVAKLGLIHLGANAQELVVAFGEPQSKKKTNDGSEQWLWQWKGESYPTSLEATIEHGKLKSLPGHGISKDYNNPYRGTVEWVDRVLSKQNDSSPKLSEDDKRLIVKIISEKLRYGAEGHPKDWRVSLYLATEAFEHGLKSAEWDDLVIQFGKGLSYETAYLYSSKPKGFEKWILKRLKNGVPQSESNPMWEIAGNVEVLIETLGDYYPETLLKVSNDLWKLNNEEIRIALLSTNFEATNDKKVARGWLLEALTSHKKPTRLAYSILENDMLKIFKGDTELIKAVEQLPKGEKGGEWYGARESALSHLKLKGE